MSWYRPRDWWEVGASFLIAVTGVYMAADAVKARDEEWRNLCYRVKIAVDRNGDGELDAEEWKDLRQKTGFNGGFMEGFFPEPEVDCLEHALELYEHEKREEPTQITGK